MSNQFVPWKAVRLKNSQKLQISVSIFLKFNHPYLLLLFAVLFSPFFFFYCFELLFLCFTKFGCRFPSLNFDKFRDTAPDGNDDGDGGEKVS